MEEVLKLQGVERALGIISQYGGIDGAHHKAWVLDQVARALTDCSIEVGSAKDFAGNLYNYSHQGESPLYKAWVMEQQGEYDEVYEEYEYEYDVGTPP